MGNPAVGKFPILQGLYESTSEQAVSKTRSCKYTIYVVFPSSFPAIEPRYINKRAMALQTFLLWLHLVTCGLTTVHNSHMVPTGHTWSHQVTCGHNSHMVPTGHTWSHLVTSCHIWSHLSHLVTPGHIYDIWSQLVNPGHIWSIMVTPVTSGNNWSHLVTPGHTCDIWSLLVTPVTSGHNWSHLVTPVTSGHIWSHLVTSGNLKTGQLHPQLIAPIWSFSQNGHPHY